MKTAPLELSEIHCDSGTQSRLNINDSVVTEYSERMAAGDKFPPLDVFFDGSDYHLADGFHRYMAAHRNKDRRFQCNIHTGTATDALWFAIGANKINGARREPGDVRRSVELALTKFQGKSQQQIADQVGCSVGYVCAVKKDIFTTENIAAKTSPTHRKDSRGRVRPTAYKVNPQPAPIHEPVRPGEQPDEPLDRPRKVTTALLFDCLDKSRLNCFGGYPSIVDDRTVKGFVIVAGVSDGGNEPTLEIYSSKQIRKWVSDADAALKADEELELFDAVNESAPTPLNE